MPDIDKPSPAKPAPKDVTTKPKPVKPLFAVDIKTGQVIRYFPNDGTELKGTRAATRKEIALAGL